MDTATYGDVSFERFGANWDCTIHERSASSEVLKRLAGHDVAVINKVVLNESVLRTPQAKGLRLIVVAATGTDNVDLEAARATGIRVSNVPGYAVRSVAQFTVALILELATRVGDYGELVRKGEWEKSPTFTRMDYPSSELHGKVLGIVGYGSIGKRVAEVARALGMEVIISARPGYSGPPPEGRRPFEEVLARSDILTLHCPLTPHTRNLIDARALSRMKPTAFLVNTARGGLVDEVAIVDCLRRNRLGGAALDVLTVEPPPPDHPVIQATKEMPNLLVTPHCAWSARETRQRLIDEVAENIQAFDRGETRNCVV